MLKGDKKSAEVIYEIISCCAYSKLSKCRQLHLLDDVVQDAYLRIFSHKRYDSKKAKFVTYVYLTVNSVMIDTMRKQYSRNRNLEKYANSFRGKKNDASGFDDIAHDELQKKIRENFYKLSEDGKLYLILSLGRDVDFANIAKSQKRAVGTIKSGAYRARNILSEIL